MHLPEESLRHALAAEQLVHSTVKPVLRLGQRGGRLIVFQVVAQTFQRLGDRVELADHRVEALHDADVRRPERERADLLALHILNRDAAAAVVHGNGHIQIFDVVAHGDSSLSLRQ